ncbi:MAG: DUF1501 domain-containing protein, partial [Actinomycetota bacterium]
DNVAVPDSVGAERTLWRRRLLEELDEWQRASEGRSGVVAERAQFYQQAYDLITSPATKRAFRLEEESDRTRERYGRNRFGQAALLARRLVEAGVRFVTVELHQWDTHENNFKVLRDDLLPTLDRFYSGLLEDLSERGLLANTLVLWMGEFGRTPKVNGRGGRDHWAYTNAIGLSGAGVRMGTVVGQTDARCERPAGPSQSTQDLAATVYRLLGIKTDTEYRGPDGRPHFISQGKPIAEVMT